MVKSKTLQNSWMTKGLLKSSKRKEIYQKFLKKGTPQNESIYNACKSFFQRLNKKYKKNYCTRHLENNQNDIKKL